MPQTETPTYGHTVVFVHDVEAPVALCEDAFGLERDVFNKSFGRLKTGETKLAFGAEDNENTKLGETRFAQNRKDAPAAGHLLSFASNSVPGAYAKAIKAGAPPVAEPWETPWGQTMSRVRDLNGVLVSRASPLPF